MKKRFFYCNIALLLLAILLVGCRGESNNTSDTEKSKDDSNTQSGEKSVDSKEILQVDKKDSEEESITETEKTNQVDKKDDKTRSASEKNQNNQVDQKNDQTNSATESNENKVNKKENESKPTTSTNENATEKSNITPSKEEKNIDSNNEAKSKVDKNLAKYSSNEIEYARIWLQLGPNQEIDELYIRHIPAGTPLNPEDKTSANYPENVTQLSGSRLVDGSVTYTSNGDGTINQYTAIPLRWDGINPAGKKEYTDILKKRKKVYVDVGNDEKIIQIINKIYK